MLNNKFDMVELDDASLVEDVRKLRQMVLDNYESILAEGGGNWKNEQKNEWNWKGTHLVTLKSSIVQIILINCLEQSQGDEMA